MTAAYLCGEDKRNSNKSEERCGDCGLEAERGMPKALAEKIFMSFFKNKFKKTVLLKKIQILLRFLFKFS